VLFEEAEYHTESHDTHGLCLTMKARGAAACRSWDLRQAICTAQFGIQTFVRDKVMITMM
jgi:hypothetical protein